MRMQRYLITCGLLVLTAGCTNQDAAQLGSFIGRTLGKPIGTVATAIDETVQTAGDVTNENPRYQQRSQLQPADRTTGAGSVPAELPPGETHYYRRRYW